jgi:hypothetical protein
LSITLKGHNTVHHSSNGRISANTNAVNSAPHFSPPILIRVKQFAEKHPGFSQGSLRGLIFYAKSRQSTAGVISGNGLESALVRIGKKILINEAKFFEWIEEGQSQ